MVYNNLGLVLKERYRFAEALACFDKAIQQAPDNALAHSNRGLLLGEINRHEEALASCDRAIALMPTLAEAFVNRGHALRALNKYEEAFRSYEQALSLSPELPFLVGLWLMCKMFCCDWNALDTAYARLFIALDRGELAAALPFLLLALPSSPAQQQQCARVLVNSKYPAASQSVWQGEHYENDRIRVVYLSVDFRSHPVTQLVAELIERHDRSRFEIIAVSVCEPTQDLWRKRLEKAFDAFYDVATQSDLEIARLIRDLKTDVAVDLTGHTAGSRTGVFSHRPAPVQVNYLGFPGTLGAAYIDYIIADPIVIPEEDRRYYDEKVVHMPNSYLPNDSTKVISDRHFTRAELGLPEDAFVFCSFNNMFKITPDVFDIWMRLLDKVDRSVLWLLDGNPTAVENLRREARVRGIEPHRIVFAPRMELAEHLARHRLADLFLDTFHYNAHTTASDALWAGLPVLTRLGKSFPARVAASLVSAVGLPELITHDDSEYEALALELATDPERLRGIRSKLARNLATQPLFDTAKYARDIETAYSIMLERSRAGLPADHIVVERCSGQRH